MPENLMSIGAAGIAAYLAKDAVQRLLGPTADYLGEGLKSFAQKRCETIEKIFENAKSKLGDKIDAPGTVPPKVLKIILNEASFSNDDLAVEYFSGILASSRTELGRDDRGARIAKIVESLSTYQLRTHYLIYSTIRKLFSGKELNMNMLEDCQKMQIFMPYSGYMPAMGFSQSEEEQLESIFPHIFYGMRRDDLIYQDSLGWGQQENIAEFFPNPPDAGIVLSPSPFGAEVFLWAFGHADKSLNYLLNSDFDTVVPGVPDFVSGAFSTKAEQQT